MASKIRNLAGKIVVLAVIAVMALSMMTVAFAAETVDTSWYNETDKSFTLTTAAQLKGLAQLVNGGNSFNGKTITLGADIDLNNEAWTPIGTSSAKAFTGHFDGGNHTISNLYVNQNADCAGLFGSTYAVEDRIGSISNIKLHNVNVYGNHYTGAVVGQGFTTDIDNCNVSGNITINGNGYVGGIVGWSYGDITNCSVIGDVNTTNTINSRYWSVGGIVGQLYGGVVRNITVSNLNISGNYYATAGVAGLAQTDSSKIIIDNASVSNCIVSNNGSDGAGYIVGTGDATNPVIIINYAVNNVTATNKGTTTNLVNGTDYVKGNISIGTDKNSSNHVDAVLDGSKIVAGAFIMLDESHLADGLTANKNADGTFTVTEGAKAEDTVVEVPEVAVPDAGVTANDITTAVTKEETKAVLDSVADSVAADKTIVGTKDEAVAEIKKDNADVKEETVTIVVKPSMKVEVKKADEKSVTYDIKALYDVVAVAESNAGAKVEKTLKADQKMDMTNKSINITLPIPASMQSAAKLFVVHTKDSGAKFTYDTVNNGNGTITFTNPNGFSEFKVTTEAVAESNFGAKNLSIYNMGKIQDGDTVRYTVAFCASIDSLKYNKVGFVIKVPSEGQEWDIYTNTVFDSLKVTASDGVTTTFTPETFGGNGKYMFFAKANINALYDGCEIEWVPYAEKADGTRVYGNTSILEDINTKF